jgi:hypothetical protein
MLATPDANQGPLLGIFITGPAGALLGAIAGYCYWLLRRGSAEADPIKTARENRGVAPGVGEGGLAAGSEPSAQTQLTRTSVAPFESPTGWRPAPGAVFAGRAPGDPLPVGASVVASGAAPVLGRARLDRSGRPPRPCEPRDNRGADAEPRVAPGAPTVQAHEDPGAGVVRRVFRKSSERRPGHGARDRQRTVEDHPFRRATRMARQLRIEVTFLSSLQQVAGRETTWLELSPGATVADAVALLRQRMPQFVGVPVITNVDGATAAPDRQLGAGDGLYLLPPG